MWDLTTKESVLTFPDHQAAVYGVAIKADGKTGFSAGEDNQVRAWNATGDQAGKQVRASGGHGKTITKLVEVAKGGTKPPLLVTASADDTVRDLERGQRRRGADAGGAHRLRLRPGRQLRRRPDRVGELQRRS